MLFALLFGKEGGAGQLKKNRKKTREADGGDARIKDFLDMIAPSVLKFNADHYICGNTFRCVWALREYPTSTSEQAILRHLGEKDGITLRIYTKQVTAAEEKRIITNAANKNRMDRAAANDMQQTVTAESNLQDVAQLVSVMHRNREPLLHCAVYIELTARDMDQLKLLQTEVLTELVRSKLNVDRLMLRQLQGFVCVMPSGHNVLETQFERVLPASSAANLYPFNYSGKTDPDGFYIGRARFGSNVIVDFDRRDEDKTNASILILGNSGQGKSYLLKLCLCNILEAGKSVICLDPEHEYADLCENLGGFFVDLMSGEYMINPLEPKTWDENGSPDDADAPQAFRQRTRLSQHVSFLKDFFRSYKDFSDRHIDVIEIMVQKLYAKWNISDRTDFARMKPEAYPALCDLYTLIEEEYRAHSEEQHLLYTAELLQEILLGLHSMCVGAESKFFSGHTNVAASRFVVFGVKGLLQASRNVKSALLFNVLSYMSDKLLTEGNTAAGIDELYLFLQGGANNLVVIEYIRSCMKRVRKKDSAMILASQNLEDFNVDGIRELTKPLFSIPAHTFLFNAGNIDKRFYIDSLQLEESEYSLIRYPQKGVCLYKCGNERYCLEVHAPAHKEKLFGKAGGR
jgi:type IV secretory pathway VirB4 component